MKNLILPPQFSQKKMIFIDFEFKDSFERKQTLVCASLYNLKTDTYKNFWLFKGDTSKLKEALLSFRKLGYLFVAYNVVAEARSLISLGLDPTKFEWIDLMLEHRQLTNSYEKIANGKQLIRGKIVNTVNETKWGKTEQELLKMNRSKPVCSLASAAYKFTGKIIDTQDKDDTIQLILNSETYSVNQQKKIMNYCESDVAVLPAIFRQMVIEYFNWWSGVPKLNKGSQLDLDLKTAFSLRGRYAALTALMVARGYPVKRNWFQSFLKKVPKIYADTKEDIRLQFEKDTDYVPFHKKTKKSDYLAMNTKNIKAWIENESGLKPKWMKTEKGDYSLSKEAWQQHYSFKHDYPRGNYAAQIMRWNSFKMSMNGFMENNYEESKILQNYGSDSRIRPYMNPYGSQTARSQPKSTFFIPLKSAWSRSLIYLENPDKFLCSIDYGSQEVLIQAIVSSDDALYGSYVSGDVYLDFAKRAGAVPKDGTKKTHKKERDVYKTAFLAIGYGVGYKKLGESITNNTGQPCSEDKAQDLIDQFYSVYWKYKKYLDEIKEIYGFTNGPYEKPNGKGFLQLPCGWILFGNNLSHRSVGNFMIQGTGSSIMREAVWMCHQARLPVVYTLHDALTCELENMEQIRHFEEIMSESFQNVMSTFKANPHCNDWAKSIRLDVNCWGEYFKDKSLHDENIKQQVIYIDERGQKDFEFYSKYFIGEQHEN